jgi:hypothetical protein
MDVFQERARHVLVLTSAGKPVWGYRGDAAAQARLASVVQALLARAGDALGGGEAL